jgi:LPXTG-motif cell wall-anchored protein
MVTDADCELEKQYICKVEVGGAVGSSFPWWIIIMVALLLIAGCFFFYLRHKKHNP